MSDLELVALLVRDYDPAIRFFVDVLQASARVDTGSSTAETTATNPLPGGSNR
jgi:catechol 2,3-dioxygenase-like lactoylglutathione lyase family enzyme